MMTIIHLQYDDKAVQAKESESVLESFLRAGLDVPFSCKAGSCHSCMVKCVTGTIPAQAQRGLSPHLVAQAYFLPCQCFPTGDMVMTAPREEDYFEPLPELVFVNNDAADGQVPYPAPDVAFWQALGEGKKVREVLETFYDKVYADPLLVGFFDGVTKDRIVGKQYSFLKRCWTGENDYFGSRPKNAHHWMVIPDALFNHRQQLMEETMQAHGLTPDQVAQWSALEERFREDIVKANPWPKTFAGLTIQTEGFEVETLTESTICDYCGAEVLAGTAVVFHKRSGKLSCTACTQGQSVVRVQPAL